MKGKRFIEGAPRGEPALLGEKKSGLAAKVLTGIFGVLVVLLAFLLIFEATVLSHCYLVNVEGDSMLNTLYGGEEVDGRYVGGDVLYADRDLEAKRGDIVIVDAAGYKDFPKSGPYLIVKRLVAVAGDRIYCEDGVVYLGVGGEEPEVLEESYVRGENDIEFDYTLGEGEIFCMGDNRFVSKDSRSVGPFREEDILGVVPAWSVTFKGPITVWENFRLGVASAVNGLVDWIKELF